MEFTLQLDAFACVLLALLFINLIIIIIGLLFQIKERNEAWLQVLQRNDLVGQELIAVEKELMKRVVFEAETA